MEEEQDVEAFLERRMLLRKLPGQEDEEADMNRHKDEFRAMSGYPKPVYGNERHGHERLHNGLNVPHYLVAKCGTDSATETALEYKLTRGRLTHTAKLV